MTMLSLSIEGYVQLVTSALLELRPVQNDQHWTSTMQSTSLLTATYCTPRPSKGVPLDGSLGVYFQLPPSAFLSTYVYVYLQFSFICCLFGWILPVFLIFQPNPNCSLGTVNRLLLWSFRLSQDVRLRVSLNLVMLMGRFFDTCILFETSSSHLGAF